MDLKITKQVEELEKYASENAEQIGAMKAFMKLNFGGEHTDRLPKLLDGSEKTPLEMLHKIGLHLAKLCEGMAQPTGENSLHKHIVMPRFSSKEELRTFIQWHFPIAIKPTKPAKTMFISPVTSTNAQNVIIDCLVDAFLNGA
jgi:hypothetical protein